MEGHKWTVFTNRLQWRISWHMGERNEGDSYEVLYTLCSSPHVIGIVFELFVIEIFMVSIVVFSFIVVSK